MTSIPLTPIAGRILRQNSWSLLRGYGWLGLLLGLTGCLDRPIGQTSPETQSMFIKKNESTRIDKIDVLFMIDNSVSMADKQQVLAAAVPQLLRRLTTPDCVNPKAPRVSPERMENPTDACKTPGYVREFSPVNDIHIGVITSSLGDAGGTACNQNPNDAAKIAADDRGWLLGALRRSSSGLSAPFLSWTGADAGQYLTQFDVKRNEFRNFVTAAGETGCGYEMSLESWYRFLVDPVPPASIDMQFPADGSTPQTARIGEDADILTQRRQFMRPDSLLAIVMLTDENDCSIRDDGRSWLMTKGVYGTHRLERGSSICETNPDDPCCYSCNDLAPPAGCASDPICASDTTGKNTSDNLRCFDQKRRLGYDFLFPTRRYVNALKLKTLCPEQNFGDLDCTCADHPGETCVPGPSYPNPIYTASPEDLAAGLQPRVDPNMVFLAGIVGVPWQDIATTESVVDSNAPLQYRPSSALDWAMLLPGADGTPPTDPLMRESIEPRTGIHPITQEPIGLPTGNQVRVNSINHHEFDAQGFELQYACIFDLGERLSETQTTSALLGARRDCGSCPAATPGDTASEAAFKECSDKLQSCSCSKDNTPPSTPSPLCQNPDDGTYGTIQYAAKAYPGTRELEVLRGHNETAKDNAVVASICPKDLTYDHRDDPGYGYNPAVASLVDRLKVKLNNACLPRTLSMDGDQVNCKVIEVVTVPEWTQCTAKGRDPVDDALASAVRRQLENDKMCGGKDQLACDRYSFCELRQLKDNMDPSLPKSRCENETGVETTSKVPGFCYIDETVPIGNPDLLASCPVSQKRMLRIVGNGQDLRAPAPGWTFIACAGQAAQEVGTP